MKGRSQQRLPIISDPPDDWGDGSWTVDCVCGVTFDDGEEMVNCDECGVWVHTRCSRYVKGEKSFACDKCKIKKGRSDNSEETEVAQLLVELPTKTVRMDGRPSAPPPSCPPRPIKRLWTDIPMEERVHVQGVPGGDPALFQGISSVFSQQLWKCTGYVPKKFNFQYKEFPCWEDKDEEAEKQRINAVRAEEESENPADRGADVLFSLSKEIVPCANQVGASGGLRGFHEGEGCERRTYPKEMKKRDWGKVVLSGGHVQNFVKKERNQLRPVAGVHLGKWKKEELAISKERSGKKKSRSSDKELNNKKRGSASATDAHKVDFDEHGDFKVGNFTDYNDMKTEHGKEALIAEPPSCESHREAHVDNHDLEHKLSVKGPIEVFCKGAFDCSSPETQVKVENVDQQACIKNGIPPRVGASETSLMENGVAKVSMKEEDVSTAVDGLNHLKDESHNMEDLNGDSSSVAVDSKISKPLDGDQRSYAQDAHDNRILPELNGVVSLSSAQTNAKAKIDLDDEQGTGDSELPSSVGDRKPVLVSDSLQHFARSEEEMSEDLQVHETIIGNSQSGEHNSQDAERVLEAVSHPDTIKEGMASISCKPHHCEQESAVPLTAQEVGSKSRHSAKYIEEPSRFGPTNPSSAAPSLRKLVAGIGKSSASPTVATKSSVSGSYKSMESLASSLVAIKPTHSSKQHVKVKSSTDHKKDNAVISVVRDESKQEVPAPVKDRPKSPANYLLKPSHATRNSHPSTCKHSLTDVKEQVLCPSNSSTMQNVAKFPGTVELSSLPEPQIVSQSKPAASSLFQKSEKLNQSSKVANNPPSVHPPAPVNSSTPLSDEELALLLHQELNSSPRVPRVPRVRHTGSIPQLSSPTATSTLAKRTSSFGGKDHASVSRRKNKEAASKDNSRNARELTDETKKSNRLSSSPDLRRRDSVFSSDGLPKRDSCNRSPDARACAKKNISLVSNSGPASSMEANDQTLSSIRSSPRDISDDDVGGVTGSTRTLPGKPSRTGLINEILSKGKRMTGEELCNAVLPHWQNLRKVNGERYAYTSHSQAVFDCLRNRTEWAQLIDRGPKTNSSRKRRKLDADTSAAESEDEDARSRPLKQIEGKSVESHREEFPKGKRKARKRRRLQLQGRVLKEVRKRQKADAVTDDDFGAYSSDGTESSFSDDENMGRRMGETSSSSDES